MKQHTPGPWLVDDENQIIAQNRVLATVSRDDDLDQWDADVCLVAAAPDLLEALITALPYIEAAEEDEAYKPGAVAKITAMVRAAIAKAEGK